MARENGAGGEGRKPETPRRRRRKGFAAAAQAAEPLLRGAGAKRGFAERRVMTEWDRIAGPELSGVCRPVKMRFRRGEGAYGATLVVEAEGPRALEAQHLSDVLIERVNAVYGYRAVARLQVVQTAPRDAALAEDPAPFEGPPPLDAPPSPDISGVDDDRLRAALARLESNIRRRAARGRPDPGVRR